MTKNDFLPWLILAGVGVVCLWVGRQKKTYSTDDSDLNYTVYFDDDIPPLEVVVGEPKELSVIDNVKKTLNPNPYIDAK